MSPFVEDPNLWTAHEPGVRALARRLLGDLHRSEDLVHDTWLAARRRRGPMRDPGAWLRGVVRHLARKVIRGEGRRTAREKIAARSEQTPSVASIIQREAVRRAVLDAVVGLDEPYRSTVLLRYFENLPPREIARQQGTPVESVRTRLKRGISMLRERLGRGESDAALRRRLVPLAAMGLGGWGKGLIGSALAQVAGVTAMTSKAKTGLALVILIVALPILWFGLLQDDDGAAGRRQALPDGGSPVAKDGTGHAAQSSGDESIPSAPFKEEQEHPEEAAPTSPFGSLRVTVVWSDKTPAAGVEVGILPWGGPDPFFNERYAKTNSEGQAVFPRVRAGTVSLSAQLGGSARAKVEPGIENEGEITIPAGSPVQGVVVDGEGQPVPNATIVLSRVGSMNEGRPVTTSDAQGRFTIRTIPSNRMRSVGARAPGFAPSPMVMLISGAKERPQLRLVLDQPGGRVEGLVLDPRGEPVRGALVEVGTSEFHQFPTEEGRTATKAGPIQTRSDASGRFSVAGVFPGENTVSIRSKRWAPWRGQADVVAGGVYKLEARLVVPVTVRGRILDAQGQPAARAAVMVGQYGDFMSSYTRAGEDGSYEMTGVAPGELELKAELRQRGDASAKMRAAAGQEVTWDARLSMGGQITGKVLDHYLKPLEGWSVGANSSEPYDHRWARTAADGTFTLTDCKGKLYVLEIRQPKSGGHDVRFEAVRLKDVKPDQDPVVIEVPAAMHATSWIEAVVVDASGKPVDGTTYSVWRTGSTNATINTPEAGTGKIRFGLLPPGVYRLSVSAPGYPDYMSPDRTLGSGETLDMGTITLAQGGRLRVELDGHLPDSPQGAMWLSARGVKNNTRGRLVREGRIATSAPLAPGEYVLWIDGSRVAFQEIPFTIRPDQVTTLSVTSRPGRKRTIILRDPPNSRPMTAHLTVTGANGATVLDQELRRFGDRPIQQWLGLEPGRYLVSIQADGRTGTGTLEVSAEFGGPETLEITLNQ